MDTPQFKTAEYAGTKSPEPCKICNQPVGATYYRVNGAVACEACATRAKSETPANSHAAFMRGLLFGIGGAIAGLIIYATFAIVTGIVIGYVSLAVGYIVGKAIKFGSRGLGGARYQIAAVLLTYAAVSMAAVPIGISQIIKYRQAHPPAHTQQLASPGVGTSTTTTDAPSTNNADQPATPQPSPRRHISVGAALLALAFAGLASPFLELMQSPVQGGIGVIILLVGIRIAWKITAGDDHAQVVGPFKNPAAAAAAPSAAPPSLG